MRHVLLTLACGVVIGAWPQAQAPDLDEILRTLGTRDGRPPAGAAAADDIRRLLDSRPRVRNFSEFRGTWALDEKATAGIRYAAGPSAAQIPVDALGIEIARRVVITGTDTELLVTKDDGVPEPYGFDGAERQARDLRGLATRYSFAFVAGALALTARTPICCDGDQDPAIEIRTDAYSLAEFDVLNVARQVSVLRQAPATPLTLSRVRSLPAPITYRRAP